MKTDKSYSPKERVKLIMLMVADPEQYAELCKKAGYLTTAFRFYSQQEREEGLEHALQLAEQLQGVPKKTVIKVLQKLKKEYSRILDIPSSVSGRGGEGDLYAKISHDDTQKEYNEKIRKLSARASKFGLGEKIDISDKFK